MRPLDVWKWKHAGGEPEIFIIGGGGKGIPLYRKLQRQGVPFAAGVLHKNDVDYQVAKALAACVIGEEPFEAICQQTFQEALAVMEKCSRVFCCLDSFGTMNEKNGKLWERAKALGKHVTEV